MTIQTGGRQILLHGLALILAGLVFGFAPPLTPYPRLALGAHIQFVTNGMLLVVLAIVVLQVPHRAGPKSVRVMVVSAWLTWFMALSEAANAWWGANQMLPIAARQAGAAGAAAWQEAVVKLCHPPAALGLILSVTLLIIGIVKHGGAIGKSPVREVHPPILAVGRQLLIMARTKSNGTKDCTGIIVASING